MATGPSESFFDSSSARPRRPRDKDGLVGRTVNDKYRVTGVIARGGMGVVYRAEQLPLGRAVALKLIHTDLDESNPDSDFQRRFFLEAASCAKLAHPNIVVIYDYGQLELSSGRSSAYMAMELLEGRTLSEAIKRDGRFTFGRALTIAREVTRALREAHGQGMVHRDLKPTNVMVHRTSDGESVKVLDFGLVKLLHDDAPEQTREGVFMGSPKYMAPEQINCEPVDARVDLYALGILLYQMLTGRVPFEGETQIQTLMAHVHDPVPPLPSEVPIAVQQIVMRCLEKNREARFASADDLVLAIDATLATLGADAGRTVTGEKPAPVQEGDTALSHEAGLTLATLTEPPFEDAAPASTSKPARTSLRWLVLGGVAVVVLGAAGLFAATLAPSTVEAPPISDAPEAAFTVFIDSAPAGAEVFRGEERVGLTPTFVRLVSSELPEGGVPLRVVLEGHGPYTWNQGPSPEDVHVRASLVALEDAAPAVAPPEVPSIDRLVPERDRTRRRPDHARQGPDDVVMKTRR